MGQPITRFGRTWSWMAGVALLTASAMGQVSLQWRGMNGTKVEGVDTVYTILPTSDGGAYLAGNGSSYGLLGIRLGPDGRRRWLSQQKDPLLGRSTWYRSGLVDSRAGLIITGSVDNLGGTDYTDAAMVAYDLDDGATRWWVAYDGPYVGTMGNGDGIYAVVANEDGTIMAAGGSRFVGQGEVGIHLDEPIRSQFLRAGAAQYRFNAAE